MVNTPSTTRRRWREALTVSAAVLLALVLGGCGGGGGGTSPPPTQNPIPTLTSISPTSAIGGGAAFTLTVRGTNFIPTSTVQWNAANHATTFTSSTELTAVIEASDIGNGGSAQVAVFNPIPNCGLFTCGHLSNVLPFTINNGVPIITSLSPASAVQTGPAFALTVNGTNFVSASVVKWNGSARVTTFVKNTRLTAAVTATDIANISTAQVTVVNPAPGGGTSNPATNFPITAPQPMSILTTSLPGSGAGKSYYFVMSATGGVPPTTWSVSAGNLPSGLALDAATDTVGTPPSSIAGRIHGDITGSTATFTVQVTDSAVPTPHIGTQQFTIPVASGALPSNNVGCPPGSPGDLATPISNGTIRASISPYKDIDVYSFHGTAGQQVSMEIFAQRLELDGDPSTQDSHLDSIMELLNSSCQTIALNDDIDLGTVTDSKISVSSPPFPASPCPPSGASPCGDITPPTTLPTTGTYYIRIRDFRSDGRPDFIYELTLSGAD